MAEADTPQAAIDLGQNGPFEATAVRGEEGKTHRGGDLGKWHSKGSCGHGGYRGGRGGGSGGQGGSNRGGRGPTIINSGIHYHKW